MRTLAAELRVTLERLVDDDDPRWNAAIQGDVGRLQKARKTLPRFAVELSIVTLDAKLHELLDELVLLRNPNAERPQPFENDVQCVRQRDPEVYACLILLAEVRNALIHSRGVFDSSRIERLRAAGLVQAEIDKWSQVLASGITLSEFLRLKSSVRNAANMILEEHGSRAN